MTIHVRQRDVRTTRSWEVAVDGKEMCSAPIASKPTQRKRGYGRIRTFLTREAAIAAARTAIETGAYFPGYDLAKFNLLESRGWQEVV